MQENWSAGDMASGEIAEYVASIRQRFALMQEIAASLDDGALNRAPAVSEGNSVYALAAHTAGNARAWILGIACGQAMRRDRPAEFASSGDGAALRALLNETLAEVTEALASLPPGRLDERLVPDTELWGLHEPREISRRRAVIQVIEHASLHVGHMELTRDLLKAGA